MNTLQIDVPFAACPPIEQCSVAVLVVDRSRPLGMTVLRQMFGPQLISQAIRRPGQWLIGVRSRTTTAIQALATEAELINAHRDMIGLRGPVGGHIEVFSYLDPELRRRVIEASQEQGVAHGSA